MKNLSVVLNIVLLAAVGFLYYHNFSGKKTAAAITKNSGNTNSPDTANRTFNVAFVDFDSLNSNIVYLRQHKKDIEQEQKNIDNDVAAAYKKLDDKQKDFIQKNQNATPEQIQQIRNELMQEQQNIESGKQDRLQQLNQKSFTLLEDVKNKLRTFITDYNKDKRYKYILMTGTGLDYLIYKDSALDITNDVIKGMNEMLKGK